MHWLQQYHQSTRLFYQLHIYLASVIASATLLSIVSVPATNVPTSTITTAFIIFALLLAVMGVRIFSYKKRLDAIQQTEHKLLHSTLYQQRVNDQYVEQIDQELETLTKEQPVEKLPYAKRLQYTTWHKEKDALTKGGMK